MKSARRVTGVLFWALSVSTALLFLGPLLWVVAASLRQSDLIFARGWSGFVSAEGWTLQNYASAVQRTSLGVALVNSLVQAAAIAGGGLIVNSMAAFAFARLAFRGREALFAGVVALIILPIEVLAVPLFLTARDLGLTGARPMTLIGLSLPFMAKAFNIYFLRQQLLTLPRELEEAAVLDGAGTWRRFYDVALPSIRPALATVALLDTLFHFGDFLWPLLLATRDDTRTAQIALANLFTEPPLDWGAILACSVLVTLPVVLVFQWLQRYVVITDARHGLR